MSRLEDVYHTLRRRFNDWKQGFTAADAARLLHIDRSTASRYLNDLEKQHQLTKQPGKPVRYWIVDEIFKTEKKPARSQSPINLPEELISGLIGAKGSLSPLVEKGLAALFYPDQGLHILLSGETGVGKSFFAEHLAKIAAAQPWNKKPTPFVTFNCADYAQNPELLMGHIFGIKKGAFTGADQDEPGLVDQANHGILFLDEIHRLPPSGQEMLFYLIDKGTYRRLGESASIRRARLILIGATTETLESTLLPTLLRRFSLKLTIPSLRERPDEERQAFLNLFLKQEAQKMNVPLFIEENCRSAFLKYACPGNIGQLKSDVQISCARAFMRYLQEGAENVTIQRNDLPPQVLGSLMQSNNKKDARQRIQSSKADAYLPFQNIYSTLSEMSEQTGNRQDSSGQQLKDAVDRYLDDVRQLSEKRMASEPSWVRFVDHDLLDALRESQFYFKDTFPFAYETKQLIAIALHLESYRRQQKDDRQASLPELPQAGSVYRQAAKKLSEFLNQRIHLRLPDAEVELLAHLLSATSPGDRPARGVAVFIVTHGRSTASSMAEVTNYLLGSSIIHAVDMPLTEATSVTYKKVRERMIQAGGRSGILLLVDIGSLVSMGDALGKELGIPVRTLANVNLPMVIEAGRKALIEENQLDAVYEAARSAYFALAPANQRPEPVLSPSKKQRLIATVCLTGEGTAQMLQDWLSEQLQPEDHDVGVRTIRIDPVTRDSSMLAKFKSEYQLIAIVGTVPVSLEDVPFIPALELLKTDGLTRLKNLLEMTRPQKSAQMPDPVPDTDHSPMDESEMRQSAAVGLGRIVHYMNPQIYFEIVDAQMDPIKDRYQWDVTRELGMLMHLGCLVDQMIGARLTHEPTPFIAHGETTPGIAITEDDLKIWEPLFTSLESRFPVHFDSELRSALIALGKCDYPEVMES